MVLIKAFLTGLTGVSLCMANISGIVTNMGATPIAVRQTARTAHIRPVPGWPLRRPSNNK